MVTFPASFIGFFIPLSTIKEACNNLQHQLEADPAKNLAVAVFGSSDDGSRLVLLVNLEHGKLMVYDECFQFDSQAELDTWLKEFEAVPSFLN